MMYREMRLNIASRMESHGMGSTIQITCATYELINDDFVCEPRGTVDVKGKGEMEVWLVMAANARQSEKGTPREHFQNR
jgi:class 3 adenylate cyclase